MEILYIVAFTLCFSAVSASYVIEDSGESFVYTNDSTFASVAKQLAFVDKTLLIKRIFEGAKSMLITAPSRFGKSTNMDMLSMFLAMPDDEGTRLRNHKVFGKLKIFTNETEFFDGHFGRFPVVRLDLGSCVVGCEKDAVWYFRWVIHRCYAGHFYLQESARLSENERALCRTWSGSGSFRRASTEDVLGALPALVALLHRHFGKTVVVLVDNYEAVINRALNTAATNAELVRIVRLVESVYERLLVNNTDVARAVLTGLSTAIGAGLSRLGENIERCRFLDDHRFVEFYGFTDGEATHLFRSLADNVYAHKVRESFLKRYDSYESKHGTQIYSILPVMNFLQYGLDARSGEGSDGRISLSQGLFEIPGFEKEFASLSEGNAARMELDHRVSISDVVKLRGALDKRTVEDEPPDLNLAFSYALELGCMTYTSAASETGRRNVFVRLVKNKMGKSLVDVFKEFRGEKRPDIVYLWREHSCP